MLKGKQGSSRRGTITNRVGKSKGRYVWNQHLNKSNWVESIFHVWKRGDYIFLFHLNFGHHTFWFTNCLNLTVFY